MAASRAEACSAIEGRKCRCGENGVVHAFGKPLSIDEIPIPTPGPGEVLIKVVATGVCHTDLHAAEGDWPAKPSLPFVPGHEGAGSPNVDLLTRGVAAVVVGGLC